MNLFWYTQLTRLLLPLFFLRLAWRGHRQPDYRRHWKERLGYYPPSLEARPCLWIHAVSVGETRAALPLIHALRQRYPNHALLLTHTTPTGRVTARDEMPSDIRRVYLPYDLPGPVGRFLDTFRPLQGFLLETELWPRLIQSCHERHIPLTLANARLSERSASRYARLPHLTQVMLQQLSLIAAQSPADAARFAALGAQAPVMVMGNLKFDAQLAPHHLHTVAQLRPLIGQGRHIWIAASTRAGEEALLLDAMEKYFSPFDLLVMVPRHPQRFDEVARLLDERGLAYQRRRDEQPLASNSVILLGDSMGEMMAWYALAQFALMGGTLLPLGGQNLLEPLRMGCPVLVGPHTYNFASATDQALQQNAAQRVDLGNLAATVTALLADPERCHTMGQQGQAWIAHEQGATERLLAQTIRGGEPLE